MKLFHTVRAIFGSPISMPRWEYFFLWIVAVCFLVLVVKSLQ